MERIHTIQHANVNFIERESEKKIELAKKNCTCLHVHISWNNKNMKPSACIHLGSVITLYDRKNQFNQSHIFYYELFRIINRH